MYIFRMRSVPASLVQRLGTLRGGSGKSLTIASWIDLLFLIEKVQSISSPFAFNTISIAMRTASIWSPGGGENVLLRLLGCEAT